LMRGGRAVSFDSRENNRDIMNRPVLQKSEEERKETIK
jgi:hypothetical protein